MGIDYRGMVFWADDIAIYVIPDEQPIKVSAIDQQLV